MNNETTKNTHVVIVGAGPTGLSMAIQLMRYNIDFIILEKNKTTTPFSKALVVQARTLEILEEIDLAQKAIAEGRVTTALNAFENGKRKFKIDVTGLGEGVSQFPFALSLEQCKTEKLFVDHLTENGKTISWNSTFTHFVGSENGVTAYYKTEDNTEIKIEADYIVGADGASSVIRHQENFTFEGDTVARIFYVSDVKISSSVICNNELYMFLIKKGFALFFPMQGEGHYRIVGILPDANENQTEFHFEELIPDLKKQVAVPLEFIETRWFSIYKVHSRKANNFRKGRCFIAGDAAHIHTPAGGQGMNTGIQDAYNLAWKMALTLQKKVGDTVLDSYSIEREQNARNLLNTTDKMFDIMTGSNFFWNFLRLKIFPLIAGFAVKNRLIRKKIFPLLSQTGITYHNSPLTIKSSVANIHAGMRMPYFVFENGKNIFEFLKEPYFKILFFGDEEKANFQNIITHSLVISKLTFAEIPSLIFKAQQNFYILLRPDDHIAFIGDDINICNKYFSQIETNVNQ
ncbi:MAG TPA: FAD-dependent monooxygenase [Puia sp.]|jgi:2-polyprenyl-6-methoxyphenol hydroxylase-like FAD-dependent oxidoreductase|nr:FAD-dependent monooxygenase [Puia sp.]